MGVFDEHGGGYPIEGTKSLGECKRNYEKEIEAIRAKQKAGLFLVGALEAYIDHNGRGSKQFTLTELYGSLSLEQREMEKSAQYLMDQWEKEKES